MKVLVRGATPAPRISNQLSTKRQANIMVSMGGRCRVTRKSCQAIAIAVLATGLAACGASRGVIVAQVGQAAISRATLAHWTPIEATLAYLTKPTGPVPKGVVPDPPSYTVCIAHLRQTARPLGKGQQPPATSQLRARCELTYLTARRHILEILITYEWVVAEDAARHITPSENEITREMTTFVGREFPTDTVFHEFLAATGMSAADERFLIKRNMLVTRLLQAIRTQSKAAPEHQEQAVYNYLKTFTAKWTVKTNCKPEYLTPDCKADKQL
jgi:foldase protein PrsA